MELLIAGSKKKVKVKIRKVMERDIYIYICEVTEREM